ncbi:MAG: serine acetyltransferase [Defluviimonas sp.]|nr:serine acetyltransferase [Defluviimonas sp.]
MTRLSANPSSPPEATFAPETSIPQALAETGAETGAETPRRRPPRIPSARLPEWERERPRGLWDPGRRLVRAIRRYQYWKARPGPLAALVRRWWVIQHAFWSLMTQCDIPLTVEIGGGLMLAHANGVVIHPKAKIGPNCLIMNQVTIGQGKNGGVPVLGGAVYLAPGCRVVGPIRVGDHAVVGLNAVLLKDMPPGSVAVGVPARIRVDPARLPPEYLADPDPGPQGTEGRPSA